ncbi:MAG: hypothetical protein K1X89_06575 [Myxococcaceae bacterium]|nr:hypothetical protein [Myxococcaceae bacterium]
MSPALRRLSITVVAVLTAVGCAGSGSGCGGLTPLPNGRYTGPKTDNALNIRLSAQGINYLNNNWRTLVEMFAPGATLNLPVACSKQNFSVIGDVYVSDQGDSTGSGRLDGKCDGKDLPANVGVKITGFSLVPGPSNTVDATVSLDIATGKIYLLNPHSLCDLKCSIDFSSSRAQPSSNTVSVTVKFSIDTKWDKLLAFDVQDINGTQVCGASGAPAKPKCFDPSDLKLDSEGGFCSSACDAADWDVVKNFVLKLISPLLQDKIKSAIEPQQCEQCGAGKPACPSVGGATSTCDTSAKVCMDTATNKCVPRFLGTEGRVSLGGLLGNFGAPTEAALDLSVAAGSTVKVDTGLTIGTRDGLQPVKVANCVPPQAPPPMTAVSSPNFDGEATPGSGYHVGVGIASPFVNLAVHQAHQSGALCLQLSSATVGLLTTGLFKTFLPSLGRLSTRDGKDAPMLVVLRPAKAPKIDIGKGTFDPVTKKPIDPLLLLTLPELSIDFYAMFDDRYARLFTLSADVALPLSLIFNGCSSVQPAIGDLKMLVTNIKTSNSEILAEDPKVLGDLIPAIIGLAEPAIGNALKPFGLPALGSFKLKVNEVKGLGAISGTAYYNHLGLYATLLPNSAACATSAPQVSAALKRTEQPKAAAMRATGQGLPVPRAILDVRALGVSGVAEFDYRVDEGTWSTFVTAEGNGELAVEHPVFLIQGRHVIDVRARMADDPHGVSEPVRVGVLIDWEPPEVELTADREHDLLQVTARDVVSSSETLRYAYKVGDGDFGEFGAARPIALSAVEQQGGVTVRVRDEAGNVADKVWKPAVVADHPDLPAQASAPSAAGCTAAGGAWLAVGALVGALRRRRAKR